MHPLSFCGQGLSVSEKPPAPASPKSPPKNGLRHLLPGGSGLHRYNSFKRGIGTRFATKVASSQPKSITSQDCQAFRNMPKPHTYDSKHFDIFHFTKQHFELYSNMDFLVLACILHKVGA